MKIAFMIIVFLSCGAEAAFFQQFQSEPNDSGLNCSAHQSCSSDVRSCHCDSLCTYYGDCCEDYVSYPDIFSAIFWNRVLPLNDFLQCRAIPGGRYDIHGTKRTNCPDKTYWMVSQCPPTAPKAMIDNCEAEHSNNDLIKVVFLRPVHDAVGNVFKNYYCAMCHGIPSEEITLWPVEQVCKQCPDEFPLSQNHYANLSSSNCFLQIQPFDEMVNADSNDDISARLRWCNKDMIRTCPSGVNDYNSRMCYQFMSPGYFKGSYFKNIFCAKCHGLKDELSWICESLQYCYGSNLLPVSEGMAYFDPLCSMIRCTRSNKLCDASDTRQYISLVFNDNLTCAYLEERGQRCLFQKSTLSDDLRNLKKMNGTNSLVEGNKIRKHNVIVLELPGNASTDWRIKLDQDLVNDARLLSQTERSCYLEFIEVLEVCSDQEWANLGECKGELIEVDGDRILDDKSFLTELSLNVSDDMVTIWYSVHTRFPFEERSFPEKRTLVCFAYPTIVQRSISYRIFCGVCIGVAIMAHLATFCTYAAFKPLRNTFGISLMSFVLSLAMALCLQEFVNDYVINVPYLCEAVAIVSHFFWLSSFTWMNVLAWDLRATLSLSKIRVRKPTSRRRLGAYCCFGWGMPLLVVLTCITLWLLNFHNISISYGPVRDFTCWITGGLAVLTAVGVPLAACLIANTILFTMVARSLYKHKKSSKVLDAEKGPEHKKINLMELIIYLKVSMLMGFSWIFGYLADFSKIEALWWLFYLSYLVQAVIIFAFFCLSQKTRKLWRSTSTSKTGLTSGIRLSSHSK